jgi:hypothetical protein
MNKSCTNCELSEIYGKYIPGNRIDPPEYPDPECGCDDDRIDLYFQFLEYLVIKYHYREDNETRAEYCPFYILKEE